MNLLLDTCVISELVKPRPDQKVSAWVRSQPEDRLYLSVLTLGEIQKGIARLDGGSRRERLQHWLDHDLPARFAGRIWSVTEAVALRWGRIQAEAQSRGRTMPVIDALLAATALTHRASVVTRNVDDLAPSGVEVVNPWGASPL